MKIFFRILFLAAACSCALFAGAACAQSLDLKYGKAAQKPGQVVVANPELTPDADKPLVIPEDADVREQIQLLVDEVNRLRAASARVTLIVTAELELSPREERQNATISVSGGPLEEPVSCITGPQGICAFILDPLSEKSKAYTISISRNKYVTLKTEFRPEPGAVVLLPLRVEMTPAARENRINP